ncbi:MAG: CPBP family intramembrane metalloprotease [Bacteroidales bacterium]|nr:CPBP family intramembrane metalloprotease [Bacteroidales bacterium]
MIDFIPQIEQKPVYIKLLILILLVSVSLVMTMIIGFLIALPIFGPDQVLKTLNITNLNSPATISMLKFFQVINQVGVFIIPALVYAFLENRKAYTYLGLNNLPAIRPLFISILVILVSLPAIGWLIEFNEMMALPDFLKGVESWMRESEDKTNQLTEAFLDVHSIVGLLINLLIIALLASIGEELLFRGVLLRILYDGIKNIHIAVFLSAVIFSAFHLQFFGFLPRMVLGILFGYIFLWTGSLWIPIVLHFLFNAITVVAAYLYNIGAMTTDIKDFGTSDEFLVILGSFLVTIILLLFIRRTGRSEIPI